MPDRFSDHPRLEQIGAVLAFIGLLLTPAAIATALSIPTTTLAIGALVAIGIGILLFAVQVFLEEKESPGEYQVPDDPEQMLEE